MAEVLLERAQALNDKGLWKSAIQLSGVALSMTKGSNPVTAVDALVTHADAMFGCSQHRRALGFYQQAWEICKRARPKKTKQLGSESAKDTEIRFKMAQCLQALGEKRDARSMLESIPFRLRNIEVNLALASLYKNAGVDRGAIGSYKEALRQDPYAIEAVEALISLNVSVSDVMSIVSAGNDVDWQWLENIAKAHSLMHHHEARGALDAFGALSKALPDNVDVLLNLACAQCFNSDSLGAMATFERVRVLDEHCLDRMDEYGNILRTKGMHNELNRLARALRASNDARPEGWVCIAMYCSTLHHAEKAITFIDKAIEKDERHVAAHLFKGTLLLSINRPEPAVFSFRKAYSIKRCLPAFIGLVDANLAIPKYKNALIVSKEALQLMPRNAQALTLVGIVLSHNPDGREKARKAFTNALLINPMCTNTVLALVQLDILEHKYDKAIDLLLQHLECDDADAVHTKLADVYTLNTQYSDALVHYHHALSLKPSAERAHRGLERLEKLMKGVDPDASEGDESDSNGYLSD